MISIFSDKTTIIMRAMLSQKSRKWVVRDFEKEFGLGRGRVASVLATMRRKGLVAGISSGRLAYSELRNKEELLEEWTKFYSFDLNATYAYYSHKKNILMKLKEYFRDKGINDKYALTLHTGANLITNYVNDDSIYCYLDSNDYDKLSLDLRQELDIKELRTGGNIFLIKPYYKKSIFFDRQIIKGYPIVSNVQLYLDLYNFPRRGRQHAEYLLRILREKGQGFA